MQFPPALACLVDHLIATLADTLPADLAPDERRTAARAALEALEPAGLAEIMLACRMIAAHFASMDSLRRSMQAGISDTDVTRLRANAVAAGRWADTTQRTLDKHREPAKAARATATATIPVHEEMSPVEDALARFTPEEIAAAEHALDNDPADLARNELAKRIPLGRFEDMTMEERRIAYAPRAPYAPAEIAVLGARLAAENRRPPGSGSG